LRVPKPDDKLKHVGHYEPSILLPVETVSFSILDHDHRAEATVLMKSLRASSTALATPARQLFGALEIGKKIRAKGRRLARNKFVDSKLAPCLNQFLPTFCNSLINVQRLLRNPELRPIENLVRV
jgi:hypothetical protein